MSKSTTMAPKQGVNGRKAKPAKPKKPYPDFPLYAHATGRWAKKIRQKVHYFGRWDDPTGALNEFLEVRDELMAGRVPRVWQDEGLTLADGCNHFLGDRDRRRGIGELTDVAFWDYQRTCKLLVEAMGRDRLVSDLRPDDFATLINSWVALKWAPTTWSAHVRRTRSMFRWLSDNDYLVHPIKFGTAFKEASRKAIRLYAEANGKSDRTFTAEQLRQLLRKADSPTFRAFIYLGINAAFGNHDVATLPMSAIDLDSQWVSWRRNKTGISRRCPLWAETRDAIRESLIHRQSPKNAAYEDVVFLTKFGSPWLSRSKTSASCPISNGFRTLLNDLDMYRPGLSFYSLRHTFRTVADDVADQIAIYEIMGHSDGSVSDIYRNRSKIDTRRLMRVTNHVRDWLFNS